ncbi:MAG: hypothetical protein ACRES9_11010 [Gammaproteobacteria bacterium]
MKYLIFAAFASLAAGITLSVTAHHNDGFQSCRKWENLCIPRNANPVLGRDFSSGHSAPGLWGHLIKQLPGTDVETVPSASFDISADATAEAAPGFQAYVHEKKPFPYTYNMGLVVTIKPANLAHGEMIWPFDRVLYNLHGSSVGEDYTHAIVTKWPRLPYYKIEPVFTGTHTPTGSWELVSFDLRNNRDRPPIKPLTWHVASCYDTPGQGPKMSFTCIRILADPSFPYYIEYPIYPPNVHLIPKVDAFIEKKILGWRKKQSAKK